MRRAVTSAALILFFAFAALASSPGTDIKVMGTALGVGILIDATIVRALLVPALVSLADRGGVCRYATAPKPAAKVAMAASSQGAPKRKPLPRATQM